MKKWKRREIIEYLLEEQGYEENDARELSDEELIELWDMYHEYVNF